MRYQRKRYLVSAVLLLSCCLVGGIKASAAEEDSDAATPGSGYNGIEIDGSFQDWEAVTRTSVDNSSLESAAAVFDGDRLYLYMKEKSAGAALKTGSQHKGQYTILTDTGRKTNFKLKKKSIRGIKGAKVKYSDCQFEISIPISQIKHYKETISFGYDMEDSMIIENIKNLQSNSTDKTFRGIIYDGLYGDWNYYSHTLLPYSGARGEEENAESSLYIGGKYLFGHLKSTRSVKKDKLDSITLRVNQKKENTINLRLVKMEKDGTLDTETKLKELSPGIYQFVLWDADVSSSTTSIYDEDAPHYGKLTVTVGTSDSELEFEVTKEKLADKFGMSVREIKTVEAQYANISDQWSTTPSKEESESVTPAVGLGVCGVAILAVPLAHRRKKKKIPS